MTPSIYPGDAVSNDVISMYQLLIGHGQEVQIFANNWAISEPEVRHADKLKRFLKSDHDLLIYHYSVGWDFGLDLFTQVKCNKVIKYHNVTPPEFFEGINSDYYNVCVAGRQQINLIANSSADLFLSDSKYNMSELLSAGADKAKCKVVYPFHRIDRLKLVEADLHILDSYSDGGVNILTVGRIAPNKGHIPLIEAFATYYFNYNTNARLLIVGKPDDRLSSYNDVLYHKVKDLGLQEKVIFTGGVSASALKAFYLMANVFVMTSLHEGFCVPIVEAMSMKIPIVAYGCSAVPDTVGGAGLVWRSLDPWLIAGSIDHIMSNEDTRTALSMMGWARYHQEFSAKHIEKMFLAALEPYIT
jgi:glycosyltransferase involved in cell wall biosynthesis